MDAFIGEIRLMGFPFAPKGWLYCQGQTLPIGPNQALFSLLGTIYGGDGIQTFKLPDLRGRVALGQGQGPGLSACAPGQTGGSETVGLTVNQMPAHSHPFQGTIQTSTMPEAQEPSGYVPATGTATQFAVGTSNASLAAGALSGTSSVSGGGQPHENRQPLIGMNYAIATTGYFPSRD